MKKKTSTEGTALEDIFDIAGKTVILTGAGGFFGRYIAEGLLSVGAKIILLARSNRLAAQAAEYKKKYGDDKVDFRLVDFIDTPKLEAVFKDICSKHRIDVLINNAHDMTIKSGFNTDAGRVENVTRETWMAAQEGPLWAAIATKHVAANFLKHGTKGSIVNVASMYGHFGPSPKLYAGTDKFNPAAYGSAKAALMQFTRYIAEYYGAKGIRCNSISPGPFPNVEESKQGGNTVQKADPFIERLRDRTSLHEVGHPRQLVGAIIFLASNASSYVTGADIPVDGGWTISRG
ncbi:SDR family oxidoreductase [Candidatus Woesearchaeota archaeon]|nr:SDR family oxidoreductase [Candidatus Woesearchaeota archaeon]